MSLRILHLIETGGPGGAETIFSQLSSGLQERGHSVQCVVGDGNWLPEELRRRGLSPDVLDPHALSPVSMLARLRSLLRRERFDLVHAQLFDGSVYAALAAAGSRMPVISTLHGQVDVQAGGLKQTLNLAIYRKLTSRVITVSDALQRDLQTILHIPADRIEVVHNGVDVSAFPQPSVQPRVSRGGARPMGLSVSSPSETIDQRRTTRICSTPSASSRRVFAC